MKVKILFITLSIMASLAGKAQSWSIGAAGIYGDDIGNAGIQLRGYYNLKGNRVCFGPEFSSFFTTTETHNSEVIEKKLNEVNFNLHYIFELNERLGLYPLIGVNFSSEKEEITNGADMNTHTTEGFGANVGIGMHMAKDRWVFFGEYDHLFSELSQNSFILGAFFTLGKKQNEHENE